MKRLLLLLLCFVMMSACTAENIKTPLTITYLGAYSCEFVKYIEIFCEKHPEISIKIIEYDHSHHQDDDDDHDHDEESFFYETYNELLEGKLKTDIIVLNTHNMLSFAQDRLIQDLSQSETVSAAFGNPAMMNGVKRLSAFDGKILGVPVNIHFSGFAVNLPLFEKMGIKPPSFDWTYDEVYELALLLREYNETENEPAYLWMPDREPEQYINLLYGIDAVSGIPVYNSQTFISYMRKGRMIADMGLFYTPDHFAFSTYNDYRKAKYGDNILFYGVLYAELHEYENASFRDMYILPVPRVDADEKFIGATLMCLGANAQNTEAAEVFLSQFLSEEYQYENAFEMQLFKDISKYTIMRDYSPQVAEWIAYTTEYSAPITMHLNFWKWFDTITLPQGNADTIDFEQWASKMQTDAEAHMR